MMDEVWKDIDGYEGSYQVSNLGRVRGLNRTVERSDGQTRTIPGCILKAKQNRGGYSQVSLWKDGRQKTFTIHQLVLWEFGGEQLPEHEANHIDGDKLNNRIDNLEWVTKSDNMRHAFDMGLRQGVSPLTPELVKEMRKIYATGRFTQAQIGAMFGVGDNAVSKIVRGENWASAGGPIAS